MLLVLQTSLFNHLFSFYRFLKQYLINHYCKLHLWVLFVECFCFEFQKFFLIWIICHFSTLLFDITFFLSQNQIHSSKFLYLYYIPSNLLVFRWLYTRMSLSLSLRGTVVFNMQGGWLMHYITGLFINLPTLSRHHHHLW